MRAREMMKRLDRLPKRKGGVQKVPDLSLLSPEEQEGGAERASCNEECCTCDEVGHNHQGQSGKHRLPEALLFAVEEGVEFQLDGRDAGDVGGGEAVDGFLGGVFPEGDFGAALGAAAVLWNLRDRFRPGVLFALYLVLSGVERLLVEFIRRNKHVALGLTLPQLISIVMIAAGAAWLVAMRQARPLAAAGSG